ncbi:Histidine kinase-, DNA gyrase B-, and HSP90-like ATPase [Pseudoalteromonas denitrificans DSM 6059]|uniref:histidine kinase n=2 Tax=Pseudoalteromonas TaxID=53246 RepID=A0A1I1JRV3_9GAMM|nr:Histidine kinase-, DNA gyrase B-, and HSP90-like ATPase [Pseudoalteromonas denitrificans DSM 6059]
MSKLSLFSVLLLLSGYCWQQYGISAVFLVICILMFSSAYLLYKQLARQHQTTSNIIRALANGDVSLGLPLHHPLRSQFDQVRDQMKSSRFSEQKQIQFLQALLLHLEHAILVIDDTGEIIQSNPASERLLGKLPKNIKQHTQLETLINDMQNQKKSTLDWYYGEQSDVLSVHLSQAHIQDKQLKIISIQSIYNALQAKEQQAYKRLTKVLTHEIANSITPMASLANTSLDLMPKNLTFNDEEDKHDLSFALQTLANRSQHLSDFIASFKQISNLASPQLTSVNLAHIIEQVITLFKQQATQNKVNISFCSTQNTLMMIDVSQIEQVLINLIKNSFEAIEKKETKKITLKLKQNHLNQVLLDITDSGDGINEHASNMIFVPFFTTKQQGSGIGLSLAHHIMVQHGGDLAYIDKPDVGACFRLTFN